MAALTEQEARGLDMILKSLGAVGYAVCILREGGERLLSTSGGLGFDGAAEAFADAQKMREAGCGMAVTRERFHVDEHRRGRG